MEIDFKFSLKKKFYLAFGTILLVIMGGGAACLVTYHNITNNFEALNIKDRLKTKNRNTLCKYLKT